MSGLEARVHVERSAQFRLDVELTIPEGRTVALLGPNGAGKSTAVATLAGLTPLQAGHIKLDGRVLDDPAAARFVPPEERQIGVVFQDYVLFPHLTVAENVAFGLRSGGSTRAEVKSEVVRWLDRFGLGDLAVARPPDLSGGQAQQVALARALITEPKMLLLDEPLAALDVTTRAQLRHELIDHLEGFSGPRLLITHDPTEAFLLADEIYIIEGGRITQVGSADDIRIRPRTSYIADLAGSNLLVGSAAAGIVMVEGFELLVGDTHISGPVLATVHPRAISVHRRHPEGSPRNTWQTEILRIEHYGDRVRLRTGDPLPLTAEVTPVAAEALALSAGSKVWISVKATEIGVEAD